MTFFEEKESVLKKKNIFSIFILVFVILGLFNACPDPNEPDPNYTVKFEANGGSPAPDPQSISKGSKVVTPPAMIKTGYGFDAWYKEAAYTNLWDFATDTVSGNITLYAKWDVTGSSTCTVAFIANGGSPAPDPQSITNGGKVVMPLSMTKTGYSFGGWYKEAACTNQWDFATDTVSGNITLYAKWDLTGSSSCTVTFIANGGSPAPDPQTISSGGKVVMPSAMTKTGYSFGGWYKEATCTNLWNFTTDTVSGNITLYAKWNVTESSTYTVTFIANGGSPSPDQQSISKGGKVVMPPAMTRINYSFYGWYKEAACTNLWYFDTDTVSGNITLYAKWLAFYTVTFNADDGTPPPPQQTIPDGGKVSKPENIYKEGYNLEGWYKDASYINLWNFESDTVTNSIILYAKWEPPLIVSGDTLFAKLQWLKTNAVSNSNYILEVTANSENIDPQSIWFSDKNNITIQLKGIGSSRVIALSGNGPLFRIMGSVTLILDENLILLGKNNNTASLVQVTGGTLIMNGGEISGNTTTSSGGGVNVSGGTFTMNGGEISGNTSSSSSSATFSSRGGGVHVARGTFTMNGGKISDNTASGRSGGGGGVSVSEEGTFIMNGGEISGNTSSSSSSSFTIYNSCGGGVYVNGAGINGAIFIMNGGEISGNTTTSSGGGVYMDGKGTFTMSGGKIFGNTASSYLSSSSTHGGGVCVDYGTFTMSGGEISGNNTSSSSYSHGGGVYVREGTFNMRRGGISGNTSSCGGGVSVFGGLFIMSGGEISSNTASSYGGGVYVQGNFTKSDGTITGYASDPVSGNVVKNSSGVEQSNQGHAVYIYSSPVKRRETTAGPGVNLDSSKSGAAEGWED